MSEPARPVEAEVLDPQKYAEELKGCEALVAEVEAAEREFRAGNPIAARMHLMDVSSKARGLVTGEVF